MSVELTSLAGIISTGVENIKSVLDGTPLPPLDDAEVPGVMSSPRYLQCVEVVLAAASRLIAAIQNPSETLQTGATGHYTSAMLHLVVEANITEALKEAGPQGLHVVDLAQKVGMEPTILARCLRYLCIRHIYREVSPDVFANNRVSAGLDTGKSFEEVKDRSVSRYDGAKGIASGIGQSSDCMKGATILSEILLDPKKSVSLTPATSPAMQALNFNGDFFEWIEQPGNEKILARFGSSMRNLSEMFSSEMMVDSYDWQSIPKGSTVVDVGGGIGGATMPIAKQFPDLSFLVQDRALVVASGKKHWESKFPEALESGLVQFQEHDFFASQPVKDAAVFMLRFILHDWPDVDAQRILKSLRNSAKPSTKLLLVEVVVPYTCPVGNDLVSLPEVLQGNLGQASAYPSMLDISMYNIFGAQERTKGEWERLVSSGGWTIESIKRGPLCSIVCTPA